MNFPTSVSNCPTHAIHLYRLVCVPGKLQRLTGYFLINLTRLAFPTFIYGESREEKTTSDHGKIEVYDAVGLGIHRLRFRAGQRVGVKRERGLRAEEGAKQTPVLQVALINIDNTDSGFGMAQFSKKNLVMGRHWRDPQGGYENRRSHNLSVFLINGTAVRKRVRVFPVLSCSEEA